MRPFKQTIFSLKWWLNQEDRFADLPTPVMSVTVAIPARNEGKWVAETIESVLAQTYNSFSEIQIVTVNEGSDDDTGSVMDSFECRFPGRIRVIHNYPASGRKAAASNMALAITDTELFLALDGDAILAPDAIEKAVRAFLDPDVKMAAGNVKARFSETIWEKARSGEYLASFSTVKPAQANTFGLLIASGCFSLVRTDALREVGGYSTRTLGEDLDLTLMFHERKWKVRLVHDAVCTVVDPKTLKNLTDQLSRWNHSYIQNMKVRGGSIFSKNFWVGLAFYGYFTWAFISPILFLIAMTALVTGNLPSILVTVMAWGLMWIGVTIFWMVIKGLQVGVPIATSLMAVPAMAISQYVNIAVFYHVFFKEFILGVTESGWRRAHD